MVSDAAKAIMAKCGASASRTVNGGIAYGVGSNNALTVTVATYDGPQPTCRGSFRNEHFAAMCTAPLSEMEVETEPQTFGPGINPRPDVVLPAVIRSRE